MNQTRIDFRCKSGQIKTVHIGRQLGKASFNRDQTGSLYVVKAILVRDGDQKAIDEEIERLLSLKHPNIVRLFASSSVISVVYLLLEYCESGNLNTRLPLGHSAATGQKWMIQIADALKYLHARAITHRDLKPENILLTSDDSIKVANFGFERSSFSRPDGSNCVSNYTEYYMGTYCDSKGWMAPEVFSKHYTGMSDIFSLGTIFYCITEKARMGKYYGAFVIFKGERKGIGEVMHKGSNKHASQLLTFRSTGQALKELILRTLEFNPKNRPSAFEVYNRITMM